jgi:hypothetical protein
MTRTSSIIRGSATAKVIYIIVLAVVKIVVNIVVIILFVYIII